MCLREAFTRLNNLKRFGLLTVLQRIELGHFAQRNQLNLKNFMDTKDE